MEDTVWYRTKSFVGEVFWETWSLLLLSLILTVTIFFAEYGAVLITLFEQQNDVPSGLSEQLLSNTMRTIIGPIDTIPYMDKISVALFWAIIAMGLYMTYSLVGQIVEHTKEQVRMDKLSKLGMLKAVCIHFGEKIVAIIVFFVVAILGFTVLMDYWLHLMGLYILSGFAIEHLGSFIVGVFGLVATLYLLSISAYMTWFYERRTLS